MALGGFFVSEKTGLALFISITGLIAHCY